MSTFMTLVFRPFAIISGLLLLILSIMIFRKTKDATKGWFFLAMFGISLFLWSTTAMLLKGPDLALIRMISGIVFLLCIAVFVAYSYSRLADDLWVEKPKWVTSKNSLIAVIAIFFVLLLSNFLFFRGDFTALLPKLLSISHQTLAFSFILATIPTFFLWKKSKEWRWGTAFWAMIVVGLALNLGQYYDGCCGESGQLAQEESCSQYDLDYMRVYDLPCSEGLMGILKFYQLLLVLGSALIDVSFFLVLRSLRVS